MTIGAARAQPQLHVPRPPFEISFKLFYTEDTRLLSPAEAMALHPRLDMITYQ